MFLYLNLKQGAFHVVNCTAATRISEFAPLLLQKSYIISVIFLFLSLSLHFTPSLKVRHKRSQTIHKELCVPVEYENIKRRNDKKKNVDVQLLLYYSSDTFGNCTRALTTCIHFPLILDPLGLKPLKERRGSLPMSPCLLPSQLPLHTKTATVPQTKTWMKPSLWIPALLKQTSLLVLL